MAYNFESRAGEIMKSKQKVNTQENLAISAMQMLQTQMSGMAESAGLDSKDAVMDLVKEIRNEDRDK